MSVTVAGHPGTAVTSWGFDRPARSRSPTSRVRPPFSCQVESGCVRGAPGGARMSSAPAPPRSGGRPSARGRTARDRRGWHARLVAEEDPGPCRCQHRRTLRGRSRAQRPIPRAPGTGLRDPAQPGLRVEAGGPRQPRSVLTPAATGARSAPMAPSMACLEEAATIPRPPPAASGTAMRRRRAGREDHGAEIVILSRSFSSGAIRLRRMAPR